MKKGTKEEDYRKRQYVGGTIDWEGIIKELKIGKDTDGYEYKYAVIDYGTFRHG